VQEVVEGIIGNKNGMCGLATSAHDSNGGHEVLRTKSVTTHIQRIPSPSPPKAAPKLKYSHVVESTL